MKKPILLFTILISFSFSFLSCRDNVEEADEVMETEVYEDEVATNGFGDYDLNDDNFWDSDEFGDAYDEDWITWDADGDTNLNDREFYTTTYGWVDTDNDNFINEAEWNEGYNNLYSGYGAVGDFDEYDLNDDSLLDENEWFEGWGNTDWFNDYDVNDDLLVNNDEWDDGIFGLWDENDDDLWDEREYTAYNAYYDTW